MKLLAYLRLIHRAWRYRLHTEHAEVRFMLDTIRPGQCVVDIGAHKAAFTYWMAKLVGSTGRVLAFEPQPDLAEYLRDAARRIGSDTVRVFELALSDEEGDSRLYFRGEHAGAASLEVQHGPSVPVSARTLDQVIQENDLPGPVSFIKCDVEEHELAVFSGAKEVLRNDKPVLLFESANIETGQRQLGLVTDYLRDFGYEGYFFKEKTLHPFAEFSPERFHFAHLAQQNFVFIPADVFTLEQNNPPYHLCKNKSSQTPMA
jgi:FkbM family methyltransferase